MAERNLRAKIERLRRIMHLIAAEKGLSHPDVLKVSKLLDHKLNEYTRRSQCVKN